MSGTRMLCLWGRIAGLSIAMASIPLAAAGAPTGSEAGIRDRIAASRHTLNDKKRQRREELEQANAKHNLANSYRRDGERTNDTTLLEQAIATFREAA